MVSLFTIGVEEEFILVDQKTGEASQSIHSILDSNADPTPAWQEHCTYEFLQSIIETTTAICPTIDDVQANLLANRELLVQLLTPHGVGYISAGTHPVSAADQQKITNKQRYRDHLKNMRDAVRTLFITGLHIHIGIDESIPVVPLLNQLRTWIPHFLALSSNSPFQEGRNTGIKSYRSIIWKQVPRTDIPPAFASDMELHQYINTLVTHGYIESTKSIWWDIRPHMFYHTIEFRMCDMPATMQDSVAIAALAQSLVATLVSMQERGEGTPVFAREYIEQNKWMAMRDGLDAEIIDYTKDRKVSMRDSIGELLDFVQDAATRLGSEKQIAYLRHVLTRDNGTGADQQIAIFNQRNNAQDIVLYLMALAEKDRQIAQAYAHAMRPAPVTER